MRSETLYALECDEGYRAPLYREYRQAQQKAIELARKGMVYRIIDLPNKDVLLDEQDVSRLAEAGF